MDANGPVRISLGRVHDFFKLGSSLEIHDGKITFIPGTSLRDIIATTEAPFPAGASLEYHVEAGDLYFAGDGGLVLNNSWAGSQQLIVGDRARRDQEIAGPSFKHLHAA